MGRLAVAPISWGVCEVPDWGLQMQAERVLGEAAGLGVSGIESGPAGFLPGDSVALTELLRRFGLQLVGGFVPAVLHEPSLRDGQLELIGSAARMLAAGGAEVLVLAPIPAQDAFVGKVELDDSQWMELFSSIERASAISAHHRLQLVVHPHFGTAIEREDHVLRLLEGSDVGLCLDTGHLLIGGANPVEIARVAGSRVRHVHLKDADPELARLTRSREIGYVAAVKHGLYRALGKGGARIADVVRLLERDGYAGWYVLERDIALEREPPEHAGPARDVRRDLEFVKHHIQTSSIR